MVEKKRYEKVRGVYEPLYEEIEFSKVWGKHEFTDDECRRLLKGEQITFLAMSNAGMSYVATGSLEYQTFEGKSYWGFKRNFETKDNDRKRDIDMAAKTKLFAKKEKISGVYTPTNEFVQFNRKWAGHLFDDDECRQLLNGLPVTFTAVSSKGEPFTVTGSLRQQEYNDKTYWGFSRDMDALPSEWQGHRFTHQEMEDLLNGDTIYIPDAVSRRTNRPLRCTLCFTEVNGRKKLVPVRV